MADIDNIEKVQIKPVLRAESATKGRLFNISPETCLKVYPRIFANADRTFEAAKLLRDNGFYGAAIPVATASMEEYIKAFILQLDGLGFDFRNTPGVNRFFKDHVIRHVTTGIVLCVYVVGKDILDVLKGCMSDPFKLAAFAIRVANTEQIAKDFQDYIRSRATAMKTEYQFFMNMENLRQLGFYCEHPDGFHSPDMISYEAYQETFEKFEKIRWLVREYSGALAQKDQKEVVERMVKLMKENDFYQKLATQLSGVRSEELFQRFERFLEKMENFGF